MDSRPAAAASPSKRMLMRTRYASTLSGAIRGEAMMASAITGAARQASQAPERNMTAVMASSIAVAVPHLMLIGARALNPSVGAAARTNMGTVNCASACRKGRSLLTASDNRWMKYRKTDTRPSTSATAIHFQSELPARGARSHAGSAWIQEKRMGQPPPSVTSSEMPCSGTGRVYGNRRTRS